MVAVRFESLPSSFFFLLLSLSIPLVFLRRGVSLVLCVEMELSANTKDKLPLFLVYFSPTTKSFVFFEPGPHLRSKKERFSKLFLLREKMPPDAQL